MITEALTQEELREIAGRHHKGAIIEWLNAVRWHYTLNAAGEPIVGRWYVRMKLSGIDPTNGHQVATFPAFDKVA